ncbi:hypothetical protein ACFYO0_18695 [Streptomyces sp. NPDC006365]|uniref:hypothetical protein n=1 Tax=Streptomyces sp. NPDC006365 TaxID=3364744 RepID=UPI0036A0996A
MAQRQWRPGERVSSDEGSSRPPLPDLPCLPAMRGYGRLREALDTIGFRHVADALRAPTAARHASFGSLPQAETDRGFRVLDGLWFPGRGNLWQRVDLEYVRKVRADWLASGDARAAEAAGVVDTLEAYVRHEPMGLRRLLLWQLGCLLRDGSDGATEEAAVALGVHRDEARHLAAAVAAGFPAAGDARRAAERLGDMWPGDRLRETERFVAEMHDTGRDPALTQLLESLRARSTEVARLTAGATRLAANGSARAAASAWLGAARRAADDSGIEAALLAAAAHAADTGPADTGARLEATVHERTVTLTWPPARSRASGVTYRLLRFPDGSPGAATDLSQGAATDAAGTAGAVTPESADVPVGADSTGSAGRPLRRTDADAPVGHPLRYAVVPLRRGLIAAVPLVSAPVVIAPDVAGVTVTLVPGGVRLRWGAPDPACTAVSAHRIADGAPAVSVTCGRDGLLDVPLAPGDYTYEVRCGYPGPGEQTEWSPGVRVGASAEEWPGQVEDLTARFVGDGDRVALTWRPPDRGRSTVLPWRSVPVGPGTDVSGRAGLTVPESPADPEPSVEVAVPERSRLRMTSVSVLGERTVTGPDVVVERPGMVRDLTAHRISADRAAVRFDWPEPAVLVVVRWEGGGRREERRVARSRYLVDQRVSFDVTPDAYRFTVAALPRPDALAVPADAAVVDLPAVPAPPRLLLPALSAWSPSSYGWWTRWRRRWPFRI